jgi:molecular chaperone GrpE
MQGDIKRDTKKEAGSKEKTRSKEELLKEELEDCKRKAAEYLAGWQRAKADFLNYKREEMERISKILKTAGQDLILKILPILDNFDEAEKKLSPESKNDKNISGLLQIKSQIQDFLNNQGVKEIETKNQKFDPNLHEAVEEVEAKGEESGMIVEEVRKGYITADRVIRPAKVKVAK